MAHAPRWKDLTIGIAATTVVVLAAAGVLVFGRVGALRGKAFSLYVTTGSARGVIRGTEVWLEGQRVGTVNHVDFRPPAAPPDDRLVLSLSVLKDVQPDIRLDTRVEVRPGSNVIGDQVVYMSGGTAKTRGVVEGDTIHSGGQLDLETVTSDAALTAKELPAIMENVKLLTAQLKSTQGTLGAFGVDQGGPEMTRIRARTARLLSRLSDSKGTLPMVMSHSDILMARAGRAMAQTDSIRSLLGSNQHSLGRFRRDSTIMRDITRLRGELAELQRLAASPDGTIGRLRADSVIVRNIRRDLAALDSLIADIKKHPLRYNPF